MRIYTISPEQFLEFASSHPLNSYMQTQKYALVMADNGYDYEYIGYGDGNTLVAAALILSKTITGKSRYGYAPKGILIDYYNEALIKEFLNALKAYYEPQEYVFIKFNPEIIIGTTDKAHKFVMTYNGNVKIIDELTNFGVKRRKELKEFDLMQPRYNAYIDLKTFDIKKIDRECRKKVGKTIKQGMSLITGDVKDIDKLYPMLKTKRTANYYKTFYNVFDKDKSIDLVLVQMDFESRLESIKKLYEQEQLKNESLNNIIQSDPSPNNLTRKMASDRLLENIKNNILLATESLKKNKTAIVGGALIVKHYNRISVITSGYSEEYKKYNPNYFLYCAIIERYKPYFNYLDMGGMTGKFDSNTMYKGLDEFKMKWNPIVFEFIGEFDYIVNEGLFNRLIKTSFIEDEFNQHPDYK